MDPALQHSATRIRIRLIYLGFGACLGALLFRIGTNLREEDLGNKIEGSSEKDLVNRVRILRVQGSPRQDLRTPFGA